MNQFTDDFMLYFLSALLQAIYISLEGAVLFCLKCCRYVFLVKKTGAMCPSPYYQSAKGFLFLKFGQRGGTWKNCSEIAG